MREVIAEYPDGTTKTFTSIREAGRHFYMSSTGMRRKVALGRIDDVKLKCEETLAQNRHGTRTSYALRGCRCVACKKANSEYIKTWHKNNKNWWEYG